VFWRFVIGIRGLFQAAARRLGSGRETTRWQPPPEMQVMAVIEVETRWDELLAYEICPRS